MIRFVVVVVAVLATGGIIRPTLSSALSTRDTSSSSSRRVFLRKLPDILGTSATFTCAFVVPSANAYGEFEPGAKARRKALQESRSSQQRNALSNGNIIQGTTSKVYLPEQNLKAALSDYSYGPTQTTFTKRDKK